MSNVDLQQLAKYREYIESQAYRSDGHAKMMFDLIAWLDEALADNAQLRAALAPFAAAWLTISSPDEVTCQIATVAQGKIIHLLFDDKDGWLRALDLRAAAAALAGDGDQEGDDD